MKLIKNYLRSSVSTLRLINLHTVYRTTIDR